MKKTMMKKVTLNGEIIEKKEFISEHHAAKFIEIMIWKDEIMIKNGDLESIGNYAIVNSGTTFHDMRIAIKEKYWEGKAVSPGVNFNSCGYKYITLVNIRDNVTLEEMTILNFYQDYVMETLI